MAPIKVESGVYWIGMNDRTTDLFEGLWPVGREGVSYNTYLIADKANAIIDLAPQAKAQEFFAQISQLSPGRCGFGCHRRIDLRPTGLDLEPERPPRAPADGGAEERSADAGERIQHQLPALGEELDESGHQARRLVGAVDLALGMTQLGRVGGRQQRLGEVEPLLAAELVERVGWVNATVRSGNGV